ncbi:MAG: polysaccharide deacetylase family protein [Treponema sp.]|jgi:peptidoglycan/xylan/chitin deacetylase (PgdA/CDA1 family)|nr:polysaccharide deacetylase family protein [Treponema sp.]
MRNKFLLWLFIFLFPLCSCKTINHSRAELNIPPSVVFFSFDDGPNVHGDTTARLLDVLKKYNIKAMFCLLGENAEQYPDLVRRMYDEGHYIANHGYSGKWASGMKPEQFRNNLVRGGEAISSALGHEMYPKLYRPHGGFYTSAQEKIIHDEGYKLVFSNVRVYDAVVDGTKQGKVVKQVVRKVEKQGGGIVLLHDARDSYVLLAEELAKKPLGVFDRSWIPDTMEKIIPALLDKGFILHSPSILTVAEY